MLQHKAAVLILVVIFGAVASVGSGLPKCGLYGQPPCVYVPAPPGHTPACASPGKTFCENMPSYPKRVVQSLLHRYGHTIEKLLVNEITEDFGANHFIRPDYHYYHHYQPHAEPHQYIDASYFPQPVHQSYESDVVGYQYPSPNQLQHPGYSYGPPKASAGYFPKTSYQKRYPQQQYQYELQRSSEYNPTTTFKRYVRSISQPQSTVPVRKDDAVWTETGKQPQEQTNAAVSNNDFLDFLQKTGRNRTRSKRQSLDRSTLCEVNTQFIQPQAALNNQGNWMYVINQSSQAKQLVKAETCASSVCSNLCQLPNTYRSRCEQKFIQKRLIALNADGQNFYTDTFWFPSCCVCTISNL